MGFSITLLPDNNTFTAEAGETILQAARRHDIKLPQGCCDGACGLCKGDVLQGTVDHGKATELALSAEKEMRASRCSVAPSPNPIWSSNPVTGVCWTGVRRWSEPFLWIKGV